MPGWSSCPKTLLRKGSGRYGCMRGSVRGRSCASSRHCSATANSSMTGDGVNDAPRPSAPASASLWAARARTWRAKRRTWCCWTTISRPSSRLCTGRRIFDNIRKFVRKYTMSSNSGEIWTLFLAPFLGLPIPAADPHPVDHPVTDGLPGLAFTAEPAEPAACTPASPAG